MRAPIRSAPPRRVDVRCVVGRFAILLYEVVTHYVLACFSLDDHAANRQQNLPDLGAPTQACDTVGGSRFFCDVYQKVGYETDFMDLNISIECYLGTTTGWDFRRASGCTCTTLLTPSNASRLPKTCPCYVCPIGFGSSSVSIDCSYLIPNATTTDADDNATAASTEPSSVPSFSPGGGGAAATTAPAASSVSSAAPVAGGGQGIPLEPTLDPAASGSPVGTTTAPSTAVPVPVPTQLQRRNLQASTGAPTPAATPLVNGTLGSNNATANETALPDPYIFDTCVSVDCGGNCNGSCSLGCDDPTASTLCDFCEGAEGSPTPGPTGAGGGGGGGADGIENVPTIGSTSGAPTIGVAALGLGWAAAAMMVRMLAEGLC